MKHKTHNFTIVFKGDNGDKEVVPVAVVVAVPVAVVIVIVVVLAVICLIR